MSSKDTASGWVAIAPAGTAPDATSGWVPVGRVEEDALAVELEPEPAPAMGVLPMTVEVSLPVSMWREFMPRLPSCRITALVIEGAW